MFVFTICGNICTLITITTIYFIYMELSLMQASKNPYFEFCHRKSSFCSPRANLRWATRMRRHLFDIKQSLVGILRLSSVLHIIDLFTAIADSIIMACRGYLQAAMLLLTVHLLFLGAADADQETGTVIPAESRPCVDCHAFEFMQRALQDLKKTAFNLDARTETLVLRAERRALCDCMPTNSLR